MALLEIGETEMQFNNPNEDDNEDDFLLGELFLAASAGDAQRLNDILLTLPPTVDLNERNKSGDTVIHQAVTSGLIPVMEALYLRGVDIHQLNKNCENALHIACRLGDYSSVKFLHEKSICLDGQSRDGDSPIHIAAKHGHFNIVEFLCLAGANLNAQDKLQETPLHVAASVGNLDCVKMLLQNSAKITLEDKNGWAALQHAIKQHQTTIALMLISAGSHINHIDRKKECPLHIACREGLLPVVQALCAYGCRVDVFNALGVTPMHIAARSGHLEIVRCLLLAGANPQLASKDGVLPDVMALAQGHSPTGGLLSKMRPERRAICVEQLVPTQRPLPRIKLKLFGHTMSGKSTIINSLRSNMITGFLRKKFRSTDAAASLEEEETHCFSMRERSMPSEINYDVQHENYTRGINIQNVNINGAGDFSVWEFSGYDPYYVFYDHFIGDTSCIHVIIFNLMDSFDMMRQKVLFWVNFIMSRIPGREPLGYCGKPRSMARLILVGTHADKAAGIRNQKGLIENNDALAILQEVEEILRYKMDVCEELYIVNCLDALSNEMKAFRAKLNDWRILILKYLPRANGFLDVVTSKIPDWICGSHFPVYSWQQFVETIRNKVNPLCSEDHLKDLIQQLQYTGEVVYIESESEHDMIVLSPSWLCTNILGFLLCHDNISQARVTGSFTIDDIQFMIAEAEAHQLSRILIALELCTQVDIEEETQYEFPCLNFLESTRGMWDKDNTHEKSAYGGIQFRSSRSQLVHLFQRIQCCLRRSLKADKEDESAVVLNQTDLFQWFHGSKLTINKIECIITMEECDQVVRIRARGPQDDITVLFGIYQDIINLIEQTIDEICPGLEYEIAFLNPKELRNHSRVVIAIPQEVIGVTIFNHLMSQKTGTNGDSNTNGEVTELPSVTSSIVVNFEEGLVQEALENLLCFGNVDILSQLKLGPELHLSSLRTPVFQRLCLLFDPPDEFGKDWCLLAVKLGMTQHIPKIDNSNEWLRSRTSKILDEWGKEPESTVGKLTNIFKEMLREDAVKLLMERGPLYTFSPHKAVKQTDQISDIDSHSNCNDTEVNMNKDSNEMETLTSALTNQL